MINNEAVWQVILWKYIAVLVFWLNKWTFKSALHLKQKNLISLCISAMDPEFISVNIPTNKMSNIWMF